MNSSFSRLPKAVLTPLPTSTFQQGVDPLGVVVEGGSAFEEERFGRARVGSLELRMPKRCARCSVTTVDQATAEVGKEPLRTLAKYRRDPASPTEVIFGQNLIHETKRGRLHVGDAIAGI